ncbi:hybrid sensor histidine kinase/response regulator [Pararobbsia alpina]|uniref:histidine kinase n=1 Tax=Pararobbsia alpina TaxID=621374 RepID=A0A6S7BBR0_9BURK|nr:PAS domain S-box protein [Pararobbsia alpina]CAB3783589.1 Sensor histidine kinase RcsC [Pararobbsia alpina]
MNIEASKIYGELTDEQSFRLLVTSVSDYAIYMLNPAGFINSWNTGAQRFNGYVASEIIGQHFSVFYTEEDRASGKPARALNTAATEGKFEDEGWRVRKDGTRFWASVVVDPIRTANGRLIGFAKITRDISERKAAEDALRESEDRFRLLVQGVTDYAIFMISPTGEITNWNSGAERIKGYSHEEVVGTHFSRFYTEGDRARNMPAQTLAIAAKEGRFEQEGWRVRKDGTLFWAHVVVDAIYDDAGKHVGFAKVTRDITERKQAAEALERANAALFQSQKMEALGKLTGGVAHDFNNLLQVIGGNLQLLAQDVAGMVKPERRVRNALAGVARGAKLAAQLLAFGRRQPLEPKVVNLGHFLRGLDDMLRRALGDGIEIETVVSGDLWNTLVDPFQVEHAILNLAINARDAMDGRGHLTIETGNASLDDAYVARNPEASVGQFVMIAVTDTGSGIPADVLTHVLEPFFTTKAEGQGTGLGLSMVYGFVRQSGGHLQIYSEVGHGTTVRLYLPRVMQEEDLVGEMHSGPITGGTETVLVAEDDEEVRKTVIELLLDLGYRVLKAKDATAALAIIESGAPIDLLFTDVVMPGPLRSPDLARKARERLPHLAVLFTSGYTENAVVHAGRLDDGVELLSKPYTREALARKIRHVLRNRQQRAMSHKVLFADVPSSRVAAPDLDAPRVLLVEDDELIRAGTAEMLRNFGLDITEAATGAMALRMLQQQAVDILLVDVGLPDTSGIELSVEACRNYPRLRVIIASGHDVALNAEQRIALPNVAILRKPYDLEDLRRMLGIRS